MSRSYLGHPTCIRGAAAVAVLISRVVLGNFLRFIGLNSVSAGAPIGLAHASTTAAADEVLISSSIETKKSVFQNFLLTLPESLRRLGVKAS